MLIAGSLVCPFCGEEFGNESYIATIRNEQAEISFSAGMQEVVDWLAKYQTVSDPTDSYFRIPNKDIDVLLSEVKK